MSDDQARLIREFNEKLARRKAEEAAREAKLLADHRKLLEQVAEDHGAYKDEKPLSAELIARELAKHDRGIQHADDYAQQAVDDAQKALDLKQQAQAAEEARAAEIVKQRKEEAARTETERTELPKAIAPDTQQPSGDEWQQKPGSIKAVERSTEAQLAQRQRMNNAGMDRLAELGPNRHNYKLLSANEIQQRFGNPELEARYNWQEHNRADADKTNSSTTGTTAADAISKKKDNGLMDFVTAATKKKDEDRQAELRQQFLAAGKGMTR